MAWRRPGNKPLSELMMVSLLMHICVTQPQWVNIFRQRQNVGHFANDLSFEIIFCESNCLNCYSNSIKFDLISLFNSTPLLVQKMVWYETGQKSISESIIGMFTMYICFTWPQQVNTVYPKKYAHGFCFAVLCCGYTLTDFPISIRLTSLALWQSNDCPSASKATLMNMDKYFMWIRYKRLHNHKKAKHNKTVCIFLGIYCITPSSVAITQNPSFLSVLWQTYTIDKNGLSCSHQCGSQLMH